MILGRAVEGVGLLPLDCWQRGLESRYGHEYYCLVSVVRCVGRDLCDKLVTLSEKSYRMCVI
jgi:hypothetical protein